MKKVWSMLIFILLLATVAQGAEQAEVPSLHYIIPAKAGGGFEHSSRAMSGSWSELLGNPIEFSFEPGMSGGIGFGKLMARPADGYTVLMTEISMHAMHINMGVVLDGWHNIGFIGNLITDPNVLLVNIDSPYKTLQDFIDAGKKATTPLKISTSQPESISTLAAKIFIKETGINAEVVAYRGGSEARAMLASGKADASIGPYFSASSMKDKIKALASFTHKKFMPGYGISQRSMRSPGKICQKSWRLLRSCSKKQLQPSPRNATSSWSRPLKKQPSLPKLEPSPIKPA